MELSELQEKADNLVREVDSKFDVKRDNNLAIVQFIEEVGEFVKFQSKNNLNGEEINPEKLSADLRDVMIVLSNFASMNDIDLEKAIVDKMNSVRQKYLEEEE